MTTTAKRCAKNTAAEEAPYNAGGCRPNRQVLSKLLATEAAESELREDEANAAMNLETAALTTKS